jgi:prevent-host-death family protein
MTTITQRELRNDNADIMRRLTQGEEFLVTRNGTPVGQLTPLQPHCFVSTESVLAIFRGSPHIDAKQFRADLDEVVSQDCGPRV